MVILDRPPGFASRWRSQACCRRARGGANGRRRL